MLNLDDTRAVSVMQTSPIVLPDPTNNDRKALPNYLAKLLNGALITEQKHYNRDTEFQCRRCRNLRLPPADIADTLSVLDRLPPSELEEATERSGNVKAKRGQKQGGVKNEL